MPEQPSAIVTGASAGIGLAVSRMLRQRGLAVTMVARHADRLDEAIRTLGREGPDLTSHPWDASAGAGADEVVAAHLSRHGRLDVVVANAGRGSPGTAAAMSATELQRMLAVNVVGPFALAGASMPALRQCAADGGHPWFVVTSSLSGMWPTPGFAGYSATKSASVSLARSIASEEATHGVRACAICPAYVDTDLTRWVRDEVDQESMLRAEDVAASVAFLLDLSPNAVVTELVLRRTGAGPTSP